MEHSVEKLSGNKVKISFKVPAESFEEAIEKTYRKMRGRINVPGFRKGKAPRKLIERMYGDMVFYDDALESLFPVAYMDAVVKSDLKPVSRPELDVGEMEKGKDLTFTCEVYVQPEVKLGQYKGVEVTRLIREVSKDEVDAYIAQEQKRVARSVEITDGTVGNGDKVNLDYSGSVDGVRFEGGTAEAQELSIGSGSFIPGFEEQMVGMAVGEERDINVKFPESYHSKDLEGKDAVFHVKVNGITREELPEIDDEFASEVSDFDTLKEYEDDVRAKLQEAADAKSEEAARESMVHTVVENAEIDIPEPMVEDKLNEIMDQMSWRMQQQGFTMKKYMEITGQTEAQMRDMYREEAKNNLKTELVLDEIIKAEDVKADEEKVENILAEYASATGKTAEEFKAGLTESQMTFFTNQVKVKAALDMLWEQAKVEDKKAEDAQAADGSAAKEEEVADAESAEA